MSEVTGKPLIPVPGYLLVHPLSPARLLELGHCTRMGYLEGVLFTGVAEPPSLLVRELSVTTAS